MGGKGADEMFSYKLSENAEVRLLEERHAQELTDLIDRNREHLRAWLPWVDTNRTVEDRKTFIRGALKQFAKNKGFVAGIWHEGRLAGALPDRRVARSASEGGRASGVQLYAAHPSGHGGALQAA